MTTTEIQKLANKLGISYMIINSWVKKNKLLNLNDAIRFFNDNEGMIKAQPFVKWVGGKRQLISQLEKLFPNDFNDYFEPFVGGGAVFFNVHKEKSFLSDINEELINTYKVVKNHPHELIEFLKTFKYDKEFYLKIRAWDRDKNRQKKYTDIQRAGRFIYLNRTCFNGLYRVNSNGQFNVPMGGYNNPDFIQEKNILNCSLLLNETKAQIEVRSFEKVLEDAREGDFVYFDPPYDTLTESANFTSYDKSGFGHDMQIKLRDVFVKLDKKGCKVMLSNHNTTFIRDIYKGYKFKIVKASRMINSKASGRGKIDEIVVLNY